MLLLFQFSNSNSFSQSQFTLSVTKDISYAIGFCDIITFTITIRNTGPASPFTGSIKFYNYDFKIVDVSDLPSSSIDIQQYQTFINFATPSISLNQTVSYDYQLIVQPFVSYNYHTVNRATKTTTTESKEVDEYIDTNTAKPIPYHTYTSTYVSEILEDYDEGNGPLVLFPVEPLPSSDQYACNDVYSQSLFVEYELVFDLPEYCIYNGSNAGGIIVEAGGIIKILDGASLYIDGQTIRSCHKMWKGFYVEKGGTLALNNCIVANAQYGIQAERGATISAHNTVFLNTYIGLYVAPFDYQPDPENPKLSYVNILGFSDNLFIGLDEMLPGYASQYPSPGTKPYAGISVNNLASFVLPGFVVSSTNGSANFFENVSNGILANNASLMVGDAFFKDIVVDPLVHYPVQGYGIQIKNGKHTEISGNTIGFFSGYTHHFDNVTTGIHNEEGSLRVVGMTMNEVDYGITSRNVRNNVIHISDNGIDAHVKGIVMNHCLPRDRTIANNSISVNGDGDTGACIELNDYAIPTFWNVENNNLNLGNGKYGIIHNAGYKVSIKNNTIDLNHYSSEEKYGIYLGGSKNSQVSCNEISGDIEGSNYHLSTGIYGSSADRFNIACNEVSNFRFGIGFAGMHTNSKLRGNTFASPNWDGLLLGRYPDDGNSVIGFQSHAGNIWEGDEEDYIHYAAIHLGDEEIVLKSLFIIDTLTDATFIPPSISSITSWFNFKDDIGNSFTCAPEEICPEGIGYIPGVTTWDSLDIALIEGNLGFEYFDNPLSWSGRLHVYHRLKDVVGSLLPPEIGDFLEDEETLNIGKFSSALDSLETALVYSGSMESTLTDFPEFLSSKLTDLIRLNSMLNADRNNDSIKEAISVKLDSIAVAEYTYLRRDSMIQDVLDIRLDNLIADIESISPDSIWEEKLQFTLLETVLLAKTDTLTSSAAIYTLANTCPDRFSDAVYIARSLIRMDSLQNYFDDYDLCTSLYPRSDFDIQVTRTLEILPNPALNYVKIVANDNISSLIITDFSGKLMRQDAFSLVENEIVYDVSDFIPGAYIVCVKLESGKMSYGKMIIVR